MTILGIGEIARRSGVPASTIRYYERIGLLPPAQRISGKRRYDESVLRKIAVIRMARTMSLTIAEVQTLVNDFPDQTPPATRWQTLAHAKLPELEAQIQHLQEMKTMLEQTTQCQCATLEDCGQTTC